MKKTMSFEEAFRDYSTKAIKHNKLFPGALMGSKIVDLEYGPDADGDPQLYYIVLDNGIKIGMARVYNEKPHVKELDRTERYSDGSIIRFQFHNWPLSKTEKKEKELDEEWDTEPPPSDKV